MIRKDKPDVIWSTYPIASAHLIGLALHRLSGIPWVVDCRDSMTEENYPANPTQKKIYRWIERQIVKHAARAIFTTQGARDMYLQRYPDVEPERFVVIPNGYDEEIFRAAEKGVNHSTSASEKLTLVHSGVLYPSERDPTAFFDALSELKKAGSISGDNLNIILRATGHDAIFQPMLRQRDIEDLVTLAPGVSYNEALQEMLSVDGLLLFQASSCNHQIPAKLYEYFRAGKPVLALTDKAGNTATTLAEAGLDDIADLADKRDIQQQLVSFVVGLREGRAKVASSEVAASYSRQSLIARFAEVFNVSVKPSG
ncbi:TPR/glycosyl transferase domain protein [gamma proteobacterium IMCC2047]|nr:TPR/glycosyl transferase domain protein [gamma proteobacterium IMCC2047]